MPRETKQSKDLCEKRGKADRAGHEKNRRQTISRRMRICGANAVKSHRRCGKLEPVQLLVSEFVNQKLHNNLTLPVTSLRLILFFSSATTSVTYRDKAFNRLAVEWVNVKFQSDIRGANMADHFDCFSVLIKRGELYIGGESFPLGQCAMDILNLDSAVLTELDQRVGALMPAFKNLFGEKADSAARSAQEQLDAF